MMSRGLEVRAEHTGATAANTLGLPTVVGGVYEYDAGAPAACRAAQHGSSIADAVVALGIACRTTADRLLDPVVLTDGRRNSLLLDRMVAEERDRAEALIAGRARSSAGRVRVVTAIAQADSQHQSGRSRPWRWWPTR